VKGLPEVLWLTTIFMVILKLVGASTFSWWVVFCPIYGPFVILMTIGALLTLLDG
jgi:hypothetical protein